MKIAFDFEVNCIVEVADDAFYKTHGIEESAELNAASSSPPPQSKISLRAEMTPARNQNPLGTCTSFCTISQMEFFHKQDLSEAHITHDAERRFGDCKEGLAIPHAFQVAKDTGVVLESAWPYDKKSICWASAPDISGKPRYKLSNFQLLFRYPRSFIVLTMQSNIAAHGRPQYSSPPPAQKVNKIKIVLANRRQPVSISVPVWFTQDGHFDAGWESWDGTIKMPTPVQLQIWLDKNASPPNVSGWHCICICGYDDATGRFEFKNSWGGYWGDSGFGTIPYEYITAYCDEAMHGWV